jgi:basic amino acid/polyamine antiporter, APA family
MAARRVRRSYAGSRVSADGATDVRPAAAAPRPLLRTMDLVSLVLGIVIGAGIFGVPALVAAASASEGALLFAWLLGGLLSLAGAMCYAELATAYRHSGGEYHYLRLAFGEKLAFLFAWARLTVIPTGSIALLAYVFGDYASQVFDFGGEFSAAIHAALVIAVLTALNALGLKSGKRTQNMLTLLQVSGVVLIILAGLLLAPAAPVTPPASDHVASTNWGLVLIFVMLAYGGWNEAAYVSAEVVGPNRNLPRALLISIAVITGLYLLMNYAYVSVLGLHGMAGSPAVAADMMGGVLGASGAQLISTLVALAALASVNATILMAARTTYAFGNNTPMFGWLGHWHPRLGSPLNALLAQAGIALALVLLGALTRQGFATMVEYTAPVFWLFFLLTGVSLFVLRWRAPHMPRPFRVPLYPFTPLVFCLMCAYLLYASLRHTGIGATVGLGVLLVGVVVLVVSRPASRQAVRESA